MKILLRKILRLKRSIGSMRRWLISIFIAGSLLLPGEQMSACSFARGYFHRVTRLRGILVGMGDYWPLLGYHSYPRWIRHRVVRGNVNLRLYQYRWPSNFRASKAVATVRSNSDGMFDFGNLSEGHYTLVVDWPDQDSNLFDIEIIKLPVETSFIKIDVSVPDPDCTGGHEFIIYSF